MIILKRFCIFILSFVFFLSASADDKAKVKKCLDEVLKAGFALDFAGMKKFCTDDYVKIPENKKVSDRKMLDVMAAYWEKVQAPDLTFSELMKVVSMLKGQQLTDAQLASYRKLDNGQVGKEAVKKAQMQVQTLRRDMPKIFKEALPGIVYGTRFIDKDWAVCFYKSSYLIPVKGVIVFRKVNNEWKLSREFSINDDGKNQSVASEKEVRGFVESFKKANSSLTHYKDLLVFYSTDSLSVFPDGSSMSYQQAEKLVKFNDMLLTGNPTMVQAMPLIIEALGKSVTPEQLAKFAEQDKSGEGEKIMEQLRNRIIEHCAESKKFALSHEVKYIVVYEDCALLVDRFTLPENGRVERVSLLKKQDGKYLIYRTASRKI